MSSVIEAAIYLLVFSLPLYTIRFSLGPLPTTVLEIIFFVVTTLWCIHHYSKRREISSLLFQSIKQYPILSASITLFLLSATIGIFVAPGKFSALGIWRAYYIEPCVFFLISISTLNNPQKIQRALWALIYSGLCVALYAIFQKYTGIGIPQTWEIERRVTSIYSYPNAVGLYLAPLVAISFPLAQYYWNKNVFKDMVKSIALLCAALVMSIAIVCSQTEAALVALCVVITGYGLVFAGTRIRYATLLSTISIFVTIWLSPVIQQIIFPKLLLHDWSGFVRRVVWHESVLMLKDHWLFGAGLSGYKTAMIPYHKATYMEIFMFPHTTLLNVWTELGLLGVVVVFVLLSYLCYQTIYDLKYIANKHNTPETDWYQCVLVLLLMAGITMGIHGLVDVPYFKNDLAMLVWLLLSVFCITHTQLRNYFSPSK